MRTILRGLWILGSVGAAASCVPGCGSTCSNTDACGTYVPPGGGAGGGTGGAASGASGTGNAGSGGTSTGGSSSGASAGGSTNAGAAGESGEAGVGVPPCDTTKTPSTESCLVNNSYAVFVAPNGKDSAAGTMSAPVATLSKGIEVAAGSKFVIVCDATYDEHVVVSTGAQVYGGFACPGTSGTWVAEAGAPLFKPSDQGPALKIDTVADEVAIDGVNFEVPDATLPGGTSLAAIVNASPKVKFTKVGLKAGAGMTGANSNLTNFTYAAPNTLNGNSETVAGTGGASKTCACQPSFSSTGGLGGAPVAGGQAGSAGQPNHGAGQGGTPGSCGSTGTGKDGTDASAAGAASGAMTSGVVSIDGWTPSNGSSGTTGSPGQGGGGGASRNDLGHGGGGGCGGCGGNGATGGNGGGGSVALVAIDSPVILENATLVTSDAGNGGSGHVGQPGQQDVGASGGVLSTLNSCGGGNGGKGGDGGASGGGAGGISVGVLWKGTTPPTLTATTTTTGKAGAKGVGGVPGTNDGIAGVKQDLLQVP